MKCVPVVLIEVREEKVSQVDNVVEKKKSLDVEAAV